MMNRTIKKILNKNAKFLMHNKKYSTKCANRMNLAQITNNFNSINKINCLNTSNTRNNRFVINKKP